MENNKLKKIGLALKISGIVLCSAFLFLQFFFKGKPLSGGEEAEVPMFIEGYKSLYDCFRALYTGENARTILGSLLVFTICNVPIYLAIVFLVCICLNKKLTCMVISIVLNVIFLVMSIVFHGFYPYPVSFLWIFVLFISVGFYIYDKGKPKKENVVEENKTEQ